MYDSLEYQYGSVVYYISPNQDDVFCLADAKTDKAFDQFHHDWHKAFDAHPKFENRLQNYSNAYWLSRRAHNYSLLDFDIPTRFYNMNRTGFVGDFFI